MEMITIPFEEYNELFQLRQELHMIYSKCRKHGALEAARKWPMIPAPMLQT